VKKLQSYEQFETELKKESIPDISLDNINTKVKDYGYRPLIANRRKLIAVIAAIIVTMSFSMVVVAVYNGWQLKNTSGEVVFDFSQYNKQELVDLTKHINLSFDAEYSEAKVEAIEGLAPGEMAYFMIAEEYETNKLCNVLQKEVVFHDLQALKASTTTKLKVPEYLPDSYKFESATVLYKEEGDLAKEGEALYQEVKGTDQAYIIKKGKLTKEASFIWIKYVNDEGFKLTIQIKAGNTGKSLTADIDAIEKFNIGDKEILYIKSNPHNVDSYIFVDEYSSGDLSYYITNNSYGEVLLLDSDETHKELTREEAIKMIESLK
jgi:hypothetical protein